MADKFREIAFTESVRDAQAKYFGRAQSVGAAPERDELTPDEISFIRARDTF